MARELIPRNFLENFWDFDDDLLSFLIVVQWEAFRQDYLCQKMTNMYM